MKITPSRLVSIAGPMTVSFVMAVSAFAASPTAEDDAKIVGNWQVSPPGIKRVYEISAGHNVKMVGGSLKEKTGRLTPRNDGSYTVNLEGGAIQRIVFVPAEDQLKIEYFDNKKSLDLGLARWTSPGVRMPAAK